MLKWKRLDGEVDKDELRDDNVPDTDSLELFLQRDVR